MSIRALRGYTARPPGLPVRPPGRPATRSVLVIPNVVRNLSRLCTTRLPASQPYQGHTIRDTGSCIAGRKTLHATSLQYFAQDDTDAAGWQATIPPPSHHPRMSTPLLVLRVLACQQLTQERVGGLELAEETICSILISSHSQSFENFLCFLCHLLSL